MPCYLETLLLLFALKPANSSASPCVTLLPHGERRQRQGSRLPTPVNAATARGEDRGSAHTVPGLPSRRVFGLLPVKSTRRCHKNGSRLAGGAHRVSRRCTRRRPRQMQVTRLHEWLSSEHVSPFRSTMRALAARRQFRFPSSLTVPALFVPARTGRERVTVHEATLSFVRRPACYI